MLVRWSETGMLRLRSIPLFICVSLAAQPPKPPSEIYKEAADAVVLIQGAAKSGSGVVISQDDMMVVTNFHVISGEKSVTVRFGNGVEMTTDEVYAVDRARDLAILSLPERGLKGAELGDSESVRPGDPVVVISNPLGLERSVSSGAGQRHTRFRWRERPADLRSNFPWQQWRRCL